MRRLLKYFKSIDVYGSPPELLIHNSSTFKTNVGALFTLASLGIICYYLVRTAARLLDTTSPQVDTLENFDMARLRYQVDNTSILPVVTVSEPVNGYLLTVDEIKSLATVKGELRRYRYDYQTNKVNFFSTFIEMVDCHTLKNRKPYEWVFSDVIGQAKGKSLCFELPTDGDWEFYGDRLYGDMNVLRLTMFPCSSGNCLPPEKIANHMFYLIKHQSYVQFSDYKDPIKKLSVLRENLNVHLSVGSAIFEFYKKVHVYDTVSSLVDPNFVGTYLYPIKEEVNNFSRDPAQTVCTEATIASLVCVPYISLEFRSSGFEVTYTRNYPDILNSFSDVGGFKELVVICVTILYSWINDWLKGNYLIEEIMPLDSIKMLIKESIKLEEEGSKDLPNSIAMVGFMNKSENQRGTSLDRGVNTFTSTHADPPPHATSSDSMLKKVLPKSRESAPIQAVPVYPQPTSSPLSTADQGSSKDPEKPASLHSPESSTTPKKEIGYQRLQRCVAQVKTVQDIAREGRKRTEVKGNMLVRLAAGLLNKKYSECIYFEEIKSLVEDLSNVTLMIREINSWRAIKEILFLPHHFKLISLVEIELEARRKGHATNVEKNLKFPPSSTKHSGGPFGGGSSMEAMIENDELPSCLAANIEMKEALETLTEMVNADSRGEAPPNYSEWHRMLDRFYYKNLPQFAVNAMNLMKPMKAAGTSKQTKPPLKILKHFRNIPSRVQQPASDPLDEGSRLEMRASRDKKNLDSLKLQKEVPLVEEHHVEGEWEIEPGEAEDWGHLAKPAEEGH